MFEVETCKGWNLVGYAIAMGIFVVGFIFLWAFCLVFSRPAVMRTL
jgi:hypothetical protein